MKPLTEQEIFWKSSFTKNYIKRNKDYNRIPTIGKDLLENRINIKSVIELGSNIGLNLIALKKIFPEINLSAAEGVSVIKGSSGVRFGPEALGGAVIVEPDPMKLNDPFYLNLGSGFQTNGKGINFNLKSGTGYKKLAYFFL